MAGDERELVNEEHLVTALTYLRDLRAWGVAKRIDPWAIRKALIIVLAMDTVAALERVDDPDILFRFDDLAQETAETFIDSIPTAIKDLVIEGAA